MLVSLVKKTSRPEFVVWANIVLTAMGLLFLSRFFFYLIHQNFFAHADAVDLFSAFIKGVRFDLSTALLTISIPSILFILPSSGQVRFCLKVVSKWITTAVLIVMVCFLWGDTVFFGENARHLTIEPMGVLNDLTPMMKLILTEYPFQLLLALVIFALIAKLIQRIFHPLFCEDVLNRPWWSYLIAVVIIAGATVIGIRGGLQKTPLKSSDAVFANNPVLGNLSLNGWYSFIYTISHESRAGKLFMPNNQAFEITQRLIGVESDAFVSKQYPLMRTFIPSFPITRKNEKINVVLIVVESLNATYLQTFGGNLTVMPFLDSLASQSLIFTNCYSVGTRSFRGLCAILASYPNLVGDPYGLTTTLPQLRGLGDIFEEQNYSVRFLHGAAPGSMGIQAICNLSGYRDFITSDNFSKRDFNGSWGVWDHTALARMSEDMDLLAEPIHYGIFTLCTHAPWKLPDDFKPRFDTSTPNSEMLNTYAYLDESLRDYFARESTRDRFARTLYIVVGDHTSHASEEERFRIGCLFYAPNRLMHRVDTTFVSQLDILPTALDLAGLKSTHASFGRSMLDTTAHRNVLIMTQSNHLYYRTGDRVLVTDTEKDIFLYDPLADPSAHINLLAKEALTADSLREEFYGYYQTASEIMKENRIFPVSLK